MKRSPPLPATGVFLGVFLWPCLFGVFLGVFLGVCEGVRDVLVVVAFIDELSDVLKDLSPATADSFTCRRGMCPLLLDVMEMGLCEAPLLLC